jgi:hypothetical protein
MKKTDLIFRMGRGTCHQGIGMQAEGDLLPQEQLAIGN